MRASNIASHPKLPIIENLDLPPLDSKSIPPIMRLGEIDYSKSMRNLVRQRMTDKKVELDFTQLSQNMV